MVTRWLWHFQQKSYGLVTTTETPNITISEYYSHVGLDWSQFLGKNVISYFHAYCSRIKKTGRKSNNPSFLHEKECEYPITCQIHCAVNSDFPSNCLLIRSTFPAWYVILARRDSHVTRNYGGGLLGVYYFACSFIFHYGPCHLTYYLAI